MNAKHRRSRSSFTDKSCPDILQQAEESYITNFQVLLTTTLTISDIEEVYLNPDKKYEVTETDGNSQEAKAS